MVRYRHSLEPCGHDDEGDDAVGYGISIETGKRFAAVGPWALTPKAQLSYTSVDLDFTDAFGAEVSTRNGDSLLGRLGIALDYRNAWLGARSNMYGIANLLTRCGVTAFSS